MVRVGERRIRGLHGIVSIRIGEDERGHQEGWDRILLFEEEPAGECLSGPGRRLARSSAGAGIEVRHCRQQHPGAEIVSRHSLPSAGQVLEGKRIQARIHDRLAEHARLELAGQAALRPAQLLESARPHVEGLAPGTRLSKGSGEHDGDLCARDRVVEQAEHLLEMCRGSATADQPLHGPELEQHGRAVFLGRRLCECATKIGNGAVDGTARERLPGGVLQRRDHPWLASWAGMQKLCCDERRLCLHLPQHSSCSCVCLHTFDGGDRRVDCRAHDGVHEPEGRVGSQQVEARELLGRRRRRRLVELGERGGVAWVGVVAENRDGPRDCRSLGRDPGEPQRDALGKRASPELEHPRDVARGRGEPLRCDRRSQLAYQQRVATAFAIAGGGEGLVRVTRER
jgi:hypothetical protein